MNILDGKIVSQHLINEVSEKIKTHGDIKPPSMAIILVGNNPASESYIKSKIKACERANINSQLFRFDNSITTQELLNTINDLNDSHSIDGFIIQLPLPAHIDVELVLNSVHPDKDIDGFHPTNFGKMAMGQRSMRPATAYGILKLLQYYDIGTKGKHVVVIGRSNIVGKPVAIMLGNDFNIGRSTVTSCDINTPIELLKEETRRADIVIVAVGIPNFLTADMIKEDSTIIDVGITKVGDKILGDVNFEEVSEKCHSITPVPGGVGPMTIAGLILNTFEAWKIKNSIK